MAIDIEIPPKFAVLFPKVFGGNYTPSFYKTMLGGRGGLKSTQAAKALLLHAYVRPLRILCARETMTSMKDSVIGKLEECRDMLGLQNFFEVGNTEVIGRNGSQFIFKGLRLTPQEIKSLVNINFTWVEEAAGVTQHSLDILEPTVARTTGSEIWFTYNPENDDDPVHSNYFVNWPKDDPKNIIIETGWEDAKEMGWLAPEMEALKDRAYASDYDKAEWIWGGKTRKNNAAAIMADKCVVAEFTPDPTTWQGPYYGADWGFANDPATMGKLWINAGNLYIEDQVWGIGVDTPELPTLFTRIPGWWRFEYDQQRKRFLTTKIPLPNINIKSDSSRPETISQMVKMNVPCVPAAKWPGCIEDGVAFMRGFKQIIIHPRVHSRCDGNTKDKCGCLVGEAKWYRYKVDKSGAVLPIVIDAFNHGWDMARYALEDLIVTGEQTVVTEYDSVKIEGVQIAPELDMIDEQPLFFIMNGGGNLTF